MLHVRCATTPSSHRLVHLSAHNNSATSTTILSLDSESCGYACNRDRVHRNLPRLCPTLTIYPACVCLLYLLYLCTVACLLMYVILGSRVSTVTIHLLFSKTFRQITSRKC